jgi:hypothetical protein
MNTHLLILLSLILILVLLITCKSEGFEVVELSKTGKQYTVQEYNDSKGAADLLAQLEKNINIFIVELKKNHPNDERIKRLVKNMSSTIIEEAPHVDNESTYTINKGELIKICLREKKDAKPFHSVNTLMFVILHELAHVISKSIGHTGEFMENFRFLLREAPKYNIDYEPVDYSENKMTYCGVDVTHNPYYNHV